MVAPSLRHSQANKNSGADNAPGRVFLRNSHVQTQPEQPEKRMPKTPRKAQNQAIGVNGSDEHSVVFAFALFLATELAMCLAYIMAFVGV